MSTHAGISITRDACSAVVVRAGRVRWCARVERDPGTPIAPAVARLLATAPRRHSRLRVAVSLGASYCQVKRITNIASTIRADVASRLVEQNAASFFLRSSRLVTTGVERAADGSAWSAALDGALVDDLVDALREAGLGSAVFLPEPLAIALVLPAGAHRIADGDVVAEFSTTSRRTFARFRRVRDDVSAAHTIADPPDDLPPALRSLGDGARHYAAAFGATTCPPNHPLTWRPPADPKRRRWFARLGVGAAAATFILSMIAVLVAPGIRASIDVASALRLAARHAAGRAEAARIETDLRRVTASLDRIDRFESGRGDLALLLAALARVLPDSTALLSLRVDTVEVSLSVLTPRAADAVSALASADNVVSPRIAGSVMRDASTRATLERATIRFRRRRR